MPHHSAIFRVGTGIHRSRFAHLLGVLLPLSAPAKSKGDAFTVAVKRQSSVFGREHTIMCRRLRRARVRRLIPTAAGAQQNEKQSDKCYINDCFFHGFSPWKTGKIVLFRPLYVNRMVRFQRGSSGSLASRSELRMCSSLLLQHRTNHLIRATRAVVCFRIARRIQRAGSIHNSCDMLYLYPLICNAPAISSTYRPWPRWSQRSAGPLPVQWYASLTAALLTPDDSLLPQ